jgi:hypothetical protein
LDFLAQTKKAFQQAYPKKHLKNAHINLVREKIGG